MTTVEILRKARDHIAQPGMWWQGAYSEDGIQGAIEGLPCCLLGAVYWAVEGDIIAANKGIEALMIVKDVEDDLELGIFNDDDHCTQAEVVALFDRAIELAEPEEAP